MDKKYRKLYVVFGGMFSLFLILAVILRYNVKSRAKHIEGLNIKLSGLIKDKKELKYGHNFGVLYIENVSATVDYYNGIDHDTYHLGYINKDKAIIYTSDISSIKKNDSIIINKDSTFVYRNNVEIDKFIIDIPDKFAYYEINSIIRNTK